MDELLKLLAQNKDANGVPAQNTDRTQALSQLAGQPMNEYEATSEKVKEIMNRRRQLESEGGAQNALSNLGLGVQEAGLQALQKLQDPNAPRPMQASGESEDVVRMRLELARMGANISPEERRQRELAIAAAARGRAGLP